eukprot:COSAG02_NODE_778_length_17288_cov_102.024725_16_plen_48_part_00
MSLERVHSAQIIKARDLSGHGAVTVSRHATHGICDHSHLIGGGSEKK